MKQPKRILVFITDQQRHDTFSKLGHPIIKTPNFDKLMEGGATFTRAYSHCPLCVPARSNLWTGLPCHITGSIANNLPIPLGTVCLPEYFTDMGWYTSTVGRLHFSPPRNPHGFQRMYLSDGKDSDYKRYLLKQGVNEEHKPLNETDDEKVPEHQKASYLMPGKPFSQKYSQTTLTTDIAIKEIDNNKNYSMFMNIGYIRPHPTFSAPDDWYDMYKPEDMILPEWCQEDYEEVPKANHVLRKRTQGENEISYYLREDILRKNMAIYYGDISHIDYDLGRLTDYLKKENMFDDTLLICTSDHGEMLGNHRSYLKMSTYEESAAIPLILSWPNGIKAGKIIDEVVSLQDVFTTCLELINHPEKDKYQKYRHANLLELIEGKVIEDNKVFIETKGGCQWGVAVVQKDYKYAFYHYKDDSFDEILFDLKNDPKEFNNLAKLDKTLELRIRYRKIVRDYLKDKKINREEVYKLLEKLESEIKQHKVDIRN